MYEAKVYVTQYLLSYGIIKCTARFSEDSDCIECRILPKHLLIEDISKPYWHKSESEAFDHAHEILGKKIKSCERLLEKLKSFEVKILTD